MKLFEILFGRQWRSYWLYINKDNPVFYVKGKSNLSFQFVSTQIFHKVTRILLICVVWRAAFAAMVIFKKRTLVDAIAKLNSFKFFFERSH